jgi:hypothetical protein
VSSAAAIWLSLFRGHESTPSLRYGAIDSDILLNVNDVVD